jgi:hypothetical protein
MNKTSVKLRVLKKNTKNELEDMKEKLKRQLLYNFNKNWEDNVSTYKDIIDKKTILNININVDVDVKVKNKEDERKDAPIDLNNVIFNIKSKPVDIQQKTSKNEGLFEFENEKNQESSPHSIEPKILKVKENTNTNSYYTNIMNSNMSSFEKFRLLYKHKFEENNLFVPNELSFSKYPRVRIIEMDQYDSFEEFLIINVNGMDYLYHPTKKRYCGDRVPLNIFDANKKMIYNYSIWNILTPISDNFKISINTYCAYNFDNYNRMTPSGKIIEFESYT